VNSDAPGPLLLYMQLALRAGIELCLRGPILLAQLGSFIRTSVYYRQRLGFLCVGDYFRSKVKEGAAPLH